MTGEGQANRRRYQRLAFVSVLLAILGGLYALLHHGQGERVIPKDRAVSFGVTVRPPQPGAALHTLNVQQGDKVTLLIESEVAGEVHLHGYDHEVAMKPGGRGKIAFVADHSGQFAIELHEPGGHHREVARLAVRPE